MPWSQPVGWGREGVRELKYVPPPLCGTTAKLPLAERVHRTRTAVTNRCLLEPPDGRS